MRRESEDETGGAERWTRLHREKLVPLGWVIPAGDGLFEWPRAFRDLLFEMAVHLRGDHSIAERVEKFILTETGSRLLKDFTMEEIAVLMSKAGEFGLDERACDSVRTPRPPTPLRSLHEKTRSPMD